MKNTRLLILFSACLILSRSVDAQTYNVTVTNEPFTFLANAQNAVNDVWDDPSLNIPIGFTFNYFDWATSVMTTDFFLGSTTGGVFVLNEDIENAYLVSPFGVDLIDRGYDQNTPMSPIYYKTEGNTGQRVFTVEYNNAGFYSGLTDQNLLYIDYINLQMKFFEETGDIVFHIGPHSLANPKSDFEGYPGPSVGLFAGINVSFGTFDEIMVLTGDALNPTIENSSIESYLNWPIPENTVYRFTRNMVATEEGSYEQEDILCYPNPTPGPVHIQSANQIIYPIRVMDTQGRLIKQFEDQEDVSLEGLTPGLYQVQFRTEQTYYTKKLMLLPK